MLSKLFHFPLDNEPVSSRKLAVFEYKTLKYRLPSLLKQVFDSRLIGSLVRLNGAKGLLLFCHVVLSLHAK